MNSAADDANAGSAKPKSAGFGDLRTRLISALVLGAAAIGTLIAGGALFVMFWLAAALAVNWEWQTLIGGKRLRTRFVAGSIALAMAAALSSIFDYRTNVIALAVVLLAAAGLAAVAEQGRRAWTAGGVLYAGILILCVITIRPPAPPMFWHEFDARAFVWLFAVVWGTDVMAYFGGRAMGGPKLWPAVSAGKTWSGFFIGIFCGACFGVIAANLGRSGPTVIWPVLAVGLLAGIAAQGGDLFESSLKRRFGVKDSSALIPGHGGVMDRLDGFVTAAFLAVIIALARQSHSVGEALFVW